MEGGRLGEGWGGRERENKRAGAYNRSKGLEISKAR